MVRLYVPITGGTGPNDPRRVNLPTYQMIAETADGKTALVEIPDEDLPAGIALPNAVALVPNQAAPVLANVQAAQLARLAAHLDARYAEHAGSFRPVPGM